MPNIEMSNLSNSIGALEAIYAQKELNLAADLDYLLESYQGIHELWEQNLNAMQKVRLVVLGEAPLWGEKRSYIYNPNTANTQFFHRKDLGLKNYRSLVDSCWHEHIGPVLKRINHHLPSYVFRYKRVKQIFESMFIQKLGLLSIGSIHQNGGGVDRLKLLRYYENRS